MSESEAYSPLASRSGVLEAISLYLVTGDGSPMTGAVESASDWLDQQCFAIMFGTGNEMTVFEKYLALARQRGLISKDEALHFLLSAPSGRVA